MLFLSIFCLFLSFVLANSICSPSEPRKEGFLREPCVPGFYEGSCLIIFNQKLSLDKAMEKCQYEYGGRLATAPSNDAFKFWTRTIHFNTKIDFNNLFWIGYGKNGFNNQEPDVKLKKFIDPQIWNRVLNRDKFDSTPEWETGADKNTLEDGECPDNGVAFNPRSQKFDIKNANEQLYSLCETPRWTKLQCETEWYLIPQIRMCVKVHGENVDFIAAHAACNKEDSFIATHKDHAEVEMLRNVIVPLNLPSDMVAIFGTGGFWIGLKSAGRITYTMDGTKSILKAASDDPTQNLCIATYYNSIEGKGIGSMVNCKPKGSSSIYYDVLLPFMCQKFADQSLSNIL